MLATGLLWADTPEHRYTFEDAQTFLKTYCESCHQGKGGAGGFDITRLKTKESLAEKSHDWISLTTRIRNGEMPPKGLPAPGMDLKEKFQDWVDTSLRAEACGSGIVSGPAPLRRLNRDEYTATIRDLLDMQMEVGDALPVDGAGGEGFDNAAETLFLSPLHSEKYMEVAKFAIDFAAKEFKSKSKLITVTPGKGITPDQAARKNLEAFLPRAFRRPVAEQEVAPYVQLFRAASKQGMTFEQALFFSMRGALVSPNFLFRIEQPNRTNEMRRVDSYALASRLSYFLWGSMPDEFLFDIAETGKLHEPAVLKVVVDRMLQNDRSYNFSQRFVEQWLRTRELTRNKVPDAKLFPKYAELEDLRADVRLQPVNFFRNIFQENASLLEFIDSKRTIGTQKLAVHLETKLELNKNNSQQPQWVNLPEGSHLGGLLGMPSVLIVSSHTYRTSPVLRGAWILESLLGTPPPPPPPNVPELEEAKDGEAPKSVRERLSQHRANPACASCHDRIDPLGFALENFDAAGRWRDEDSGKPIDSTAELNDGTKFEGPAGLKKILMDRKDQFVRNLTSKMLGYALGRGLTLQDSCTVDQIVEQVKAANYESRALLEGIILSVPFQYQSPVPTVTSSNLKDQETLTRNQSQKESQQ